jgi:uncharacterized protein (DUF1499 family)
MMSFPAVLTLLLLLARVGLTLGLVPARPESAKGELSQPKQQNHPNLGLSSTGSTPSSSSTSTSRRQALWTAGFSSVTATATVFGWISGPRDNAYAFSNKISTKYDDRPKRKGPQPKDLGLATRSTMEGNDYTGLKQCGAAPNCFCSTVSVEEDPERSIPAWTWPKSTGDDQQAKAFRELKEVIEAYTPGQNGVDGGGFEIQTFDATKGYLYVQFQALKNGYIDDVEFAVVNDQLLDRAVQVRSSSRVGYLDFGVNAKRLNFIANALRAKGWDAQGVNFDTHRGYALENQV